MKLLLLVLCASVAYGLAPIQRAKVGRTVPDNWIIKIKDLADLDRIESEILGLFKQRSVPSPRVTKIDVLFPALILKVPAPLLEKVQLIEGIESINDDVIGTTCGAQINPPWGLDRIDSRTGRDLTYNYNDNRQGDGVCVFVVDTGIRTTHNVFGGRASMLTDFKEDDNGHGTHCTGTAAGQIYGIARKATIYGVKICDRFGKCPTSDLTYGLDQLMKNVPNHCKGRVVVSMSVGFPASSTVDNAVQQLIDAEYTVSVAAGNENMDASNRSPARMADVITVGNVDAWDVRNPTSNYGNALDLFAPGTSILSSYFTGDYTYATMSGTSMSCPHVTGAAALYLGEHNDALPSEVKKAIVDDATNDVVYDAKGSPNKVLYINPN